MDFKHNIHQVLWKFNAYSIRFPVTLRISYEQSSWVRGENTSLVVVIIKFKVNLSSTVTGLPIETELGKSYRNRIIHPSRCIVYYCVDTPNPLKNQDLL